MPGLQLGRLDKKSDFVINLNDFAFKIYSAFLKFSNPQLHYKEDANALSRSRSKTLISTNANH